MKHEIDLRSTRARKARLARSMRKVPVQLWVSLIILSAAAAAYLLATGGSVRSGYGLAGSAAFLAILLFWYSYDLRRLQPQDSGRLDGVLEQGLLASLKKPITPRSVWIAACATPEGLFMCNHLLLNGKALAADVSDTAEDMPAIWDRAAQLLESTQSKHINAGTIITATIAVSPPLQSALTANKLRVGDAEEVLTWLERRLSYLDTPKPYFGGIGRDWASGFTPTLESFGQNISHDVQASGGGAHYVAHSEVLEGIINNLSHNNGVALVGPDGSGKTTLVYGLAERLLEGSYPELQYYQVISLNASAILSYSGTQLEKLMLNLFAEASHAGNIVLFLDDAQLFFNSGVGSFDMGQILLPVLKNHSVKIIAAFSPAEWQQMQSKHAGLAGSFVSTIISESPEDIVLKITEDTALLFERRYGALISFEAIREAYRLSGQYLQDQSYPGKAVTLLEQSVPFAHDHVVGAETVQAAIENTKGVKVSAAAAPEADMLLHLEDHIHERMVNQKHAVGVVAAALRRGRAGVSDPKRPVGSFLFLGPTGVGKTELAKSLAAVYFGSDDRMIRIDMSEYQRDDDVARLLSPGTATDRSLLLQIREQPFSVVLLDEVEKAHPNILNILLQMLDEGQVSDEQGRPASFRSAIIIATSNAGAVDIATRVKDGGNLEGFERPLVDKLIGGGQFKPELINRFDEIVLFRPLNEEELAKVAATMLGEVNRTLASQQITVALTPAAVQQIVRAGYDPEFGARPMRRVIQQTVENAVATKILRKEIQPGASVTLDVDDLATPQD